MVTANSSIIRFIIAANTKYPWSAEHGGDESETAKKRSHALIQEQLRAFDTYRGDIDAKQNKVPAFISGAITAFGKPYQWDYFEEFKNHPSIYYGLGNEDYVDNVIDAKEIVIRSNSRDNNENNEYPTRSVEELFHRHTEGTRDILSVHVQRTPLAAPGSTGLAYTGSLSYAVHKDPFLFIQLQNHFDYRRSWSGWRNGACTISIDNSVGWLEDRLKFAKEYDRIPILLMHRSPDNPEEGHSAGESARFDELLKTYDVKVIFYGDADHAGLGIPYPANGSHSASTFSAGAAFTQSFLVGEYDPSTKILSVKKAEGNIVNPKPILQIDMRLGGGPITPPLMPPTVTVASETSTSLTFSLSHPEGPVTYEIEIMGGGRYTTNNPQYTIEGLTPETVYTYSVRAVKNGETSAPTTGSARTNDAGSDELPAPRVSVKSSTAMTLTFSLAHDDAPVRYVVEVLGEGNYPTYGNEVTIGSLKPYTSYTYAVRAIKGDKTSKPAIGTARTKDDGTSALEPPQVSINIFGARATFYFSAPGNALGSVKYDFEFDGNAYPVEGNSATVSVRFGQRYTYNVMATDLATQRSSRMGGTIIGE